MEKSLFGHPRGLFFLAFTEAWERFSFYGMQGLVVLYMIQQLLLPGHVEHIAGFVAFRAALESVFGPLSTQALASQTFGIYSGFVYFTPLVGGVIADRWIGQRNAVVLGALLMCGGHLAMTFDRSFLLALLLLVLGSGLLKGNISAQVGALYPAHDEDRRTRGFMIFSTGINVGAVLGPLVCGTLAALYGWHAGFGAAALFMIIGMGVYLYGYRYLPARVERGKRDTTPLTRADWRVMGALLVVLFISVFQSVAYNQLGNVYMVWIQSRVALNIGPFRVPAAWFSSLDSLASILCVPALFWLWRQQAKRGGEPHDLAKIGTGAWVTAASYAMLAVVIHFSHGALVNVIWPILTSTGLGIGFIYLWPTVLALVSRAAPVQVNSTMMGVTFMSLFVGFLLVGWIGAFYERMSPEQFWWLQGGIAAGGGVLVMVLGRRLERALRVEESA